jgi:hypothetical protein
MSTINSQNFQSIRIQKGTPISAIQNVTFDVNFFNGDDYKEEIYSKPTKYDIVLCLDGTNESNAGTYISNASSILQMIRELISSGLDVKIASANIGWINPATSNRRYKKTESSDNFLQNECLTYFPNYAYDPSDTFSKPFFIINEDRFFTHAYWQAANFIVTTIEYFLPKVPFTRAKIGMAKSVLDPLFYITNGNYPLNDSERMSWLTSNYVYHVEKLLFFTTTPIARNYADVWTDPQSFEDWQNRNGWFLNPEFYNINDVYELKMSNPFNILTTTTDFFQYAKRDGSQLIYIIMGKNRDDYYSSWFDELIHIANKDIWAFYFTESFNYTLYDSNYLSGMTDVDTDYHTADKDVFAKKLSENACGYWLGSNTFSTMITNTKNQLLNPLKDLQVKYVHDQKFLNYIATYTSNAIDIEETNPFLEIGDFTQPVISDINIVYDEINTRFIFTHILKDPYDLTGIDHSDDIDFFKRIKMEIYYYANGNLAHSEIVFSSNSKIIYIPYQTYGEDFIFTRSFAIDKYGNVHVAPKCAILGKFTYPNKLAMGAPSCCASLPAFYIGEISWPNLSVKTPYFENNELCFKLFTDDNNLIPDSITTHITLISDDLRVVLNEATLTNNNAIKRFAVSKNYLHTGSYYYSIKLTDEVKTKVFDGFCQYWHDAENSSLQTIYQNWAITIQQVTTGCIIDLSPPNISDSYIDIYRNGIKIATVESGERKIYHDSTVNPSDVINGHILYEARLITKFEQFSSIVNTEITLLNGNWNASNSYLDPFTIDKSLLQYYNGYNTEYQVGKINLYDARFFNILIGDFTRDANARFQNAEVAGGGKEEADQEFLEEFNSVTTIMPEYFIHDSSIILRFIESISSQDKKFETDKLFDSSLYNFGLIGKYVDTCIIYPFRYHKTYKTLLPIFAFNITNAIVKNYVVNGISFSLNIPKIGEIKNTRDTFYLYTLSNPLNVYYGHSGTGISIEFKKDMIPGEYGLIENTNLNYKSGFFFNSKLIKTDQNGIMSFIFNNYEISLNFSTIAYFVSKNNMELFKEYIFQIGEDINQFFEIAYDSETNELIPNEYLIQLTVYHNEMFIYMYNYNIRKEAFVYQFFTDEPITPLTHFGIKFQNGGGSLVNPVILNLDDYYCGTITLNNFLPVIATIDSTQVNEIIKIGSNNKPIFSLTNYISQFESSYKTFSDIDNYFPIEITNYDFTNLIINKITGRSAKERLLMANLTEIHQLSFVKDYANVSNLLANNELFVGQSMNIDDDTVSLKIRITENPTVLTIISPDSSTITYSFTEIRWHEMIISNINSEIFVILDGNIVRMLTENSPSISEYTIKFNEFVEIKDVYTTQLINNRKKSIITLDALNNIRIFTNLVLKENWDISTSFGNILQNYWDNILKNAKIISEHYYDWETKRNIIYFYFLPYKNVKIDFLQTFGTDLNLSIELIKNGTKEVFPNFVYTMTIQNEYIKFEIDEFNINKFSESYIIKFVMEYNGIERAEYFDFCLTQFFMKEKTINIYNQLVDGQFKVYLLKHTYSGDEILQSVTQEGDRVNIMKI